MLSCSHKKKKNYRLNKGLFRGRDKEIKNGRSYPILSLLPLQW